MLGRPWARGEATRRHTRVGVAAALLLGVLILTGWGWPAPAVLKYSASSTPTSAAAGSTTVVDVTITNSATSTDSLGSATIKIPTGATLLAVGTPATTNGKAWVATVHAGVVKVRSKLLVPLDRLRPGQSVRVSLTLRLPTTPGTLTFVTAAKDTVDFIGLGRSFTRIGADPTLTVDAGAPASLAFAVQPGQTVAGAVIAPAVKVRVLDAYGNPAGGTPSVSLALGSNPGGGTLGGTTTQVAASGVAQFANLTVSRSGTGYTLVASSPGLPSATSAPFDVPLVVIPCPASGCAASTGSAPSTATPTVASVTVPPGGKAGTLLLGSDPASTDPAFCGGRQCIGLIMTVLPPGSDTGGAVTVELTYAKAVSGKSGVPKFKAYADFGSGPALLPDCSHKGPAVPPCVVKQTRTHKGDLYVKLLIPFAIDPRIGLG